MQLHTHMRKPPFVRAMFGRAALATAALGGFVLLAGAPSARADNCQRRIAHAEHELGEAIEDHGYNSRQADHWRYERHEALEACGYYRDERRNYYYYYHYDDDRDRYYRDYDRDRRRYRDWDRDRD